MPKTWIDSFDPIKTSDIKNPIKAKDIILTAIILGVSLVVVLSIICAIYFPTEFCLLFLLFVTLLVFTNIALNADGIKRIVLPEEKIVFENEEENIEELDLVEEENDNPVFVRQLSAVNTLNDLHLLKLRGAITESEYNVVKWDLLGKIPKKIN